MREFNGKVAVVTGAASGIGRAMAERFAREGMRIVLADVEEGALAETLDAFKRNGSDAIAVPTDVARLEQVEALAKRAIETFGAVHVLCNNAGVAANGTAWQLSNAEWEWSLGVNLWGVIHGVRAFVPRMIAQGEGHIVNTASIAGLVSVPASAPYCVTKHAVVALSECLHHDLAIAGHGVRVSVLCPAWVKTKIAESTRNKPSATQVRTGADLSPPERAIEDAMRAAVAAGIPPEVVAEKVLRAIVDERFWILTHSKTKKLVEARMQGILEDKNPEFSAVRA